MQLFYISELQKNDQEFTFNKNESKHIVRVLRKKKGDSLHITNGKGLLFFAEIVDANDKQCQISIVRHEKKSKPRNYNLHLAIAPTKNMVRYEWFLEKACEIGIDEVTPIICDHSERKTVKTDRLQKIIESACKQSLKFHFPVLHEPVNFNQFISTNQYEQGFMAHCDPKLKRFKLETVLKKGTDVCILIGPEGDFSASEIEAAISNKFVPITLGDNRLRTETAGIVATHAVGLLNNI